ncbi:MAG: EAL and HDOD domain-containing protein [Azonexus sp.]
MIQEYNAALPLAQFITLHAPTLYPNHCTRLRQLQTGQNSKARWLVRDLPALEDFRFAHKIGASLFHGDFVTSREEWGKREPGPGTLHIATLIAKLRADGDTKEIASLLKQDAALSLRLLRYVNSAAYQPQEPVTSIEHALLMFGRERLYRWLILLACAPDANNGRTSAALEIALVRARMLELLAREKAPGQGEPLFLVGLLSLADIILQVPLAKAIAPLSLADEVRAALLEQQGPYYPFLDLAVACEQGFKHPERLQQAAERCAITPEEATDCHLEALNWAMEVQD